MGKRSPRAPIGLRCHYCPKILTVDNATWDHLVPISRGGDNGADNKVPACAPCNNRKGPLTEFEYGIVRNNNTARKRLICHVMEMINSAPSRSG